MYNECEPADGDIGADAWIMSVVKVACILIVGIVILNGVVIGGNISANSSFYPLMTSIQSNISSGYTLASLIVLTIGAGGILHYLGYM